ncbi:MAG: permease [Bacillota bacterium]|nr:permease [Bacillota bacterium]
MNGIIIVLSIITAGLALLAQIQGGWTLVSAGLGNGLATLRSAAGLVVLAFAVTGLMQVLIEPATIRKWLGREAGLRGIMIGAAAGALTPGGPYVYYPLAMAIHRAGAGMGTIFSYLSGKALWDLARLPLELAFFGPKLTAVRWAATILVPPVAGYLGGRWFGSYAPAAQAAPSTQPVQAAPAARGETP